MLLFTFRVTNVITSQITLAVKYQILNNFNLETFLIFAYPLMC